MQYDLLKPALEIGLTPDDWSFIFWYKLLGFHPLSKIADVWIERGPYTTVPLYYTGIINSLVGFDFFKMQIIGICFKILASMVLFPLVLLVFKSRLLAILTTILFAMSYPSAGPLETAVEPSEYLGMFFMGLFLITYYQVIKNNLLMWKGLSLATTFLIIAVLFSVMRLYPLLVLIPSIEAYLLIQKPSVVALRIGLVRLFILFAPFIVVTLYHPKVVMNYIGVVPTVILRVLEGNWHLILTPLQGLGHTFPVSDSVWKIFGLLNMESFKDYFSFILGGPTVIFSLIILILSLLIVKKPWRFFLLAFCLNFILEIMVFFIANHFLSLPKENRIIFDIPRIYSTFFGLLILILSFVYWIEWKIDGRKNHLILALWVGPVISFLFIVLTWVLASENLAFGGAQDHYLMIPSVGIYLFISALLVIFYERTKKVKTILFMVFLPIFFLSIILFYFANRQLIYTYFNSANLNGRAASGQIFLQSKFKEKIKQFNQTEPMLFYFDTSEIENGPFYTESFLSSFPFWMRFQGTQLIDGCSERIYLNEYKQLIPYIKEQDGQKGFFYKGLCVENGKGGYKDIFYKPDNFYAFKLKNKDFIDIKKNLLKELGF